MIEEEKIKQAYANVKNTNPSQDWSVLFAAYNEENEHRLGMSCKICYFKVLSFIQKKFNLEPKNFARNQSGHQSTGGAVSQPGPSTASFAQARRKAYIDSKTGKTIFFSGSFLGRRPNR